MTTEKSNFKRKMFLDQMTRDERRKAKEHLSLLRKSRNDQIAKFYELFILPLRDDLKAIGSVERNEMTIGYFISRMEKTSRYIKKAMKSCGEVD